jgi:putative chitinase
MIMITPETLRQFARKIAEPEVHAAALEAARQMSSVNTPRRLCHFMGQVFVETAGFTVLEENLRYRNPERLDAVFSAVKGLADAQALIDKGSEAIANRVYALRLGNGDEASGDGWRYRGSGYKQLTGRSNFRAIGAIVGMDLEGQPELAREPVAAARIAFAFWDARQCSPLADAGDLEAITEKVNGPAKLGLAERREATLRAIDIWRSVVMPSSPSGAPASPASSI